MVSSELNMAPHDWLRWLPLIPLLASVLNIFAWRIVGRRGAALLACVAVTTAAENPWATVRTPAEGPARAIGGYSRGCVAGAKQLPLKGRGYRIGRPERGRFFGHPALVDFILDLAKGARKGRLGPLVIGDLGQPRGGPAPRWRCR